MINIKVANMLRITDADLKIEPGRVTGVTGVNASGKTSIATLSAALLSGKANPAGGKKNQKIYLQDDKETGNASLDYDGEPVARWDAVTGEMSAFESSYEYVPESTVSLVDFCGQMTQPQRVALWESFFLPEQSVLTKMIRKQLQPHIPAKTLDEIMEVIEVDDIDVVTKTYQRRAQDEKRSWMGVTGENWGVAKGADWLPDDWTSDLDGQSVKLLEEELAFQQEEMRALHVDNAVNMADIERGKEAVEEVQAKNTELHEMRLKARGIMEVLSPAKEQIKEISERQVSAESKLRRHVFAKTDKPDTHTCPQCEAELIMHAGKLTAYAAEDDEKIREQWEKTNEELAARCKALDDEKRQWDRDYGPMQKELDELVSKGRRMSGEIKQLQKIAAMASETPSDDNRDDIDKLEQRIERTKKHLRLVQKRNQARLHHENIVAYNVIAKIVGPKGVRTTCMEEAMTKFDVLLETISAVSGWPRIAIDKTFAVSIDGRTFLRLCAETDRLRAQYTLQIAIARFIRSPVVILDGVDHLDDNNMFRLKDLLNTMCARPEPPAFMICGTELDLLQLNPKGINFQLSAGKLKPMQAE